MAPNLRPTLSTRIRASLDGKKSKPTAQKPQETNTFVVQDAATLRDAIGQAISNDSFQSAIAAHLARLIEPSIKDALDTIQPVVETVYQHDILLRKTNRSVEDLLQRFDSAAEKEGHENATKVSKNVIGAEDIGQLMNEHSARNSAKIEELSGTLHEGHATTAQAVTDIAEIKTALSLSSKNLAFLTSTAQQSSTDNFKLQEQLDELKADINNILKSLETQGSTLAGIKEADLATVQILRDIQQSHTSHALALNEIKAHDQSFKSASVPIFEKTHADTATAFQALTANLSALKENLKASFASETDNISALGAKVDKVLASVDNISGNDSGHEILSAVRKSNDFHTIHVTALDGIMDRLATPTVSKDVPAETDSFATVREHLNTISNALDSHTNHLAAVRDNDKGTDILAAVRASNESHVANHTQLGEIRAATKAIEQAHTSHVADLAEIKDAVKVAGESHISHTKNFKDLQAAVTTANESHASHTMALETIKSANDNSAQGLASHVKSLEALGTQMGTVIATLGSQSIVHSDIRDTVHASQEAHTTHSADLGEIKEIVKAAGESHTAHTAALDGLRTTQESTIGQLTAHTAYLDDVRGQIGTIVNNIGEQAAMHTEIRDAVHTSNASHATHTKTLEEVVAVQNSSKGEIVKQNTTLDSVSSQLGAITGTLEDQSATHSQLLDAVQTSNTSHLSHAAALDRAESAHADILDGINVSRELLSGHRDVLSAHASLLEHVRNAHANNHSDIINAVKQSHGLLENQAGTLREMEHKHEEIRNSVQALGGGVNLNENGLRQLKDHVKAPNIAETSEPALAVIQESGSSDSVYGKKSVLGLGAATVAGGVLLASASSKGLFTRGSEVANEQIQSGEKCVNEPTTGNEAVEEVKPEDSVQDLVVPADEAERVDPEAEVTGHEEPAIEEPAIEEPSIEEPAPEEPVPEEPAFSDVVISEPAVEEPAPEELFIEKPAIDEPVFEVPGAEHSRKAIAEEAVVEEPIIDHKVHEESAFEYPVESQTVGAKSIIEEPVREEFAIDQTVTEEPAFEVPIVGESSSTESVLRAPIHDAAYENALQELYEDPRLATDGANEKGADLTDSTAKEVGEPAVVLIQEPEMLHEIEPVMEHPVLDRETSSDAISKIEEPIAGESGLEELSSLPHSSVAHPLQDADQELEEPFQGSASDHTFGVLETDKPIHDESNEERTLGHKESLTNSLVEGLSREEIAREPLEVSREVDEERDLESATTENHPVDATVDGPADESETLVKDVPTAGEESLNPPPETHVHESPETIEHVQDDIASGYGLAATMSTLEPALVEPDSVEEKLIVSEPTAVVDATLETHTSQTTSLQEIESPEIEHTAEGSSVKHEPGAKVIATKQPNNDAESAQLDASRQEDLGFEAQGGRNSHPTLDEQSDLGNRIPPESDRDSVAVEDLAIEEEKKVTEATLSAEAQPVKEIDRNLKNVREDLSVTGPATTITESTKLPAANAEGAKQEPSTAIDSMAAEATQTDSAVSTEVEEVHEVKPLLEARPITSEHPVGIEGGPQSESGIDVKKEELESEAPQEVPVLEKPFGADQAADGLALRSLVMSDSDAISDNATSNFGDETTPAEPVTIESAMKTRNGGTERRPSLVKRVSFKEPPEEVKLTHENDAKAESLSTRETIMEEQYSEAELIGDESNRKEPLLEVQRKSIAANDETVVETPILRDTVIENEPRIENPAIDSVPVIASKSPADGNSAELEDSNHVTSHAASARSPPESEQISNDQLSPVETEPDISEPPLEKLDNESSLIQSFAEDNNEVTQADAKPIVQLDLAQPTIPQIEPIIELERSVKPENAEKVPAGDNIGDVEPLAENTASESRGGEKSDRELNEGNEISSDHGAIQDSAVNDNHVEDVEISDLTHHISISDKPIEEPQNVVASEGLTGPHEVSAELPLISNSPGTKEIDEKSPELASTDEHTLSGLSVAEYTLDQPAAEAMKYNSVADDTATEESIPLTQDATVGDLAGENKVAEVTTDKIYTTESSSSEIKDPGQETSVLQIPSMDSTALKKTSDIGTKYEETTTTKPTGSTDETATESTVHILGAESSPTQAKAITEEFALDENSTEDIGEDPMPVGAAIDEPTVHESTKEIAVEPEAAEDPIKEHSPIKESPVELDTSSKALISEDTPTQEPFGTETPQETHLMAADTSAGAGLTEQSSTQYMESGVGNQDASTTKGNTLNIHGQKEEDVAIEEAFVGPVVLEGKTDGKEPASEAQANETDSTVEEVGMKAEKTPTSIFEDTELAAVTEPAYAKSEISVGPSGKVGSQVEVPAKGIEPEGVVHTTEADSVPNGEISRDIAKAPEIEATEKKNKKEELPIYDPVDLEAPATDELEVGSMSHEATSNEPISRSSLGDPAFISILNFQPTRVDSGIDVETPTDVKPDSKVEPLDTLVEDVASGVTVKERSSLDIPKEEPVMEDSTIQESVLGHISQKTELNAVESTVEEPHVEAEPVAGEAGKEVEDTTNETTEERHLFDAVDEPSSKKESSTIDPNLGTGSVEIKANGDSVEQDVLAEQVPEMHGEKDLQISTKSNIKEQHTRVDSGIDVETPIKEPLGKLQSVVEVRPALDVQPGLEGE